MILIGVMVVLFVLRIRMVVLRLVVLCYWCSWWVILFCCVCLVRGGLVVRCICMVMS